MKNRVIKFCMAMALLLIAVGADAFQFDISEEIKGSLDTTATVGFGTRVSNPSTGLVGDTNYGAFANTAQWSNGDNGNLNYRKWDVYTMYGRLLPELLIKMPEDFKFMARATLTYDFMATNTHRTGLEPAARDQAQHDFRLLDLWVSKDFELAGQKARIRAGNQVISWGESIYAIGGISQTNSFDLGKLLVPGVQLKEAYLPSPMISFATGLGKGLNMEAYYQFDWDRNRMPAVGTYWSIGDIYDKARSPLLFISAINPNFGGPDFATDPTLATSIPIPMLNDKKARNQGQFGVAFHYKVPDTPLDLGAYFLNYHEKFPVLNTLSIGEQWTFLNDRQLYGLSANMPVGNWAVGFETSYRPKDAVALSGCYGLGGPMDAITNFAPVNCQQWIDQDKLQFILTGLLTLTPGDHGWFLDILKAQAANITAEVVDIYYPGLKSQYTSVKDGIPVFQTPLSGYYSWANTSTLATLGYPITGALGTNNSLAYTLDFNWTYDGTLIPGWQVTPGVTFFHAVQGDTPTFFANYMQGAKSLNSYILFNMNPATWQAGINYAVYFGGNDIRQPLGDRDFIGGFVSYNF